MWDYLIVGTGLYGSVFARELKLAGRSVLMLERKPQVGGNIRTTNCKGVFVHEFGPHIFHSKSKKIWDYVNNISEFWPYRHQVKARYNDELFTLPFNMATFYEMWGCITPTEAEYELEKQREIIPHVTNLEEYALSTIGKDLYHKLVYGYTMKQWQRNPRTLPASIIRRLPLRMNYNTDYYDDWYQGIPVKGYTHLIEQLIDGVDVKLNSEFKLGDWKNIARKLIYSGSIDDLFNCRFGYLEYRGLRFEHQELEGNNYQGCSQMNHTSEHVPYTRIVEHKHFHYDKCEGTVITYEYPIEWEPGKTRYYPIDDVKNRELYDRYKELAQKEDIRIGGRLGCFRYFDMDQVVGQALNHADRELNPK
jgi:UDP-galactopyranose mutase